MAKYVFVTGGVCSGLGKGITASSIALLLKAKGYKVFMQKFDPYMNVDPGTMSPIQHGEVFVTADGCETDLDLGHYERFIDEELNYTSNITNGKIYSSVIEKERVGDFLGSTIQIVPHISNEIKNKIYEAGTSSGADIVITEIGGTVGDIESAVMLESLRQFRLEMGVNNSLFVHTTLVPFLYGSNELKTKPTQNSIIELRRLGIQPDIIVTRAPLDLGEHVKEKIALFGSIPIENIIEAKDEANIYQIPINFHKQHIEDIILKQFNLKVTKSNLNEWEDLISKVNNLDKEIEIALVGKYVELEDAYLSVKEALKAAGYKYNTKIKIKWVNSEDLEPNKTNLKDVFKNTQGIIVPGGFGSRGIEGMIKACNYARINKIPYLGICLGMQIAVIEFARNVCEITDASSREFDELCPNPVIDLMADQKAIINKGGTLRLGNYKCDLKKGTLAFKDYKTDSIFERHRHRYEFNNNYKDIFEKNGLIFSGINPDTNLVEIIELENHPHFIACQFHPEFKSRPTKPHPLFDSFIKSSIANKK
ncbi:MAG: CTP synthase [Bacilli bacterium]